MIYDGIRVWLEGEGGIVESTFRRADDRPDSQWLRSFEQRALALTSRNDCSRYSPSLSTRSPRSSLLPLSPFFPLFPLSLSLSVSTYISRGAHVGGPPCGAQLWIWTIEKGPSNLDGANKLWPIDYSQVYFKMVYSQFGHFFSWLIAAIWALQFKVQRIWL